MNFNRPIIFWIAALAAVVAVAVLLRGVLLPFVTGMALAYLLSPVAGRIEHLGISRLLATLAIMSIVVVTVVVLMVLLLPTIVREISYFVESLPLYVRRLQTLATDPSRPWLSKIIGDGLGEAERSVSQLTALASSSLDVFLRSLWSGGEALISFFSLAVVAPIVACYLIYDWDRMIATIDLKTR
jgi:predicted PurR-regulated permease PerM